MPSTPSTGLLAVEEQSVERSLAPAWTYAALALLVAALLMRQPYLVLIGLTLTVLVLVVAVWRRYGLAGLSYSRVVQPARAAWGDEVELTLRVANRKVLPLTWLTVEEALPSALPVINDTVARSHIVGRLSLVAGLDLAPYQAITRHYRLRCSARGYHQIGPTTLRTGDPFGLVRQQVTLRSRDYLLVYPRLVEVDILGLAPSNPLGEMRSRQRLHEDPILLAGTRDYVAGDSLRRMHWKATARLGALQVKTFDPSATLDVLIVLDASTVEPGRWSSNTDLLELGICIAASLAAFLLEARRPVGLITNGFLAGLAEEVRLLPGRSPQQLPSLLELLARLGPWSRRSLSDLLAAELGAIPPGATVAVITALLTLELADVLLAYRGAGYAVSLLLLGEGDDRVVAAGLPGIAVQYLGGEARWQELQNATPFGPVQADHTIAAIR